MTAFYYCVESAFGVCKHLEGHEFAKELTKANMKTDAEVHAITEGARFGAER